MRSHVTLAYLAGVVDSDGYITIHRSTRNGARYYAAQIGIAGTSPEPHDLAASLFGGKVSCYKPLNPGYRPQYQWSRTGRAAAAIIELLRPYLRVKARNADLAIDLQIHVDEGGGDDPFPWFGPHYDALAERERMRCEMIEVLATRKKRAGRLLDGVTHDGMPRSTT